MQATLVHAAVPTARLGDAVRAVEQELVPGFLGRAGARHGYWMAHRRTGRLLLLTVWEDAWHRAASAAEEGAVRTRVAEAIGAHTLGVQQLEVVGAHEEGIDDAPRVRWVRATWVQGLRPDQSGRLPALFREVVPDQARTRGFCASYWLGDLDTGSALGLSFWQGPAEIRGSAAPGRELRRRSEALLGCRVAGVQEFEAIGVASKVAAGSRVSDLVAPPTPAVLRSAPGTVLDRPPGELLAVTGRRTDEVVVLLGGHAALVRGAELARLGPGDHFGAHGLRERLAHPGSVMATTVVRLHVLSRAEFTTLARERPEAADELLGGDAER